METKTLKLGEYKFPIKIVSKSEFKILRLSGKYKEFKFREGSVLIVKDGITYPNE